ncbi:acylphosphatase [Sulfuriflexus sp.]|uniref:acylphosphatase n=1 Tax=Sulfuriflexus sp. TaxID=2015443 RepID=UPI0028CFB41C|nr:acylphosphatase [Sulfuriflexus sp.]MDT8403593.1 acylphosphatase [Sulfuriflexus sp.]
MKQCVHCIVSGHVQGVFYRAATEEQAGRLGLSGWIKNLPDGRVEVTACGTEPQLKQLQAWLWQGPTHAQVSEVACEEIAATDVGDDFEVRY